MKNYTTFAEGSPGRSGGRSGSSDDMPRSRRGRSQGRGGGDASMLSSVINLLNTIVGAGTLAMPRVMSHMGITLGIVLIFWSGVTASFGLYLQSRCARYLDRGSSSFFALSQLTYPNLAVIFDTAIAIKCFGVGVSYMIIIGDLMPGVMLGFNSRAAEVPYLVDRNFWITAFMLPVILLAFLRRLDSLKYTSVIALLSIGYLVILVVYHFAADSHPDAGDIRVIRWGGAIATLSSLPVVVFAYTCHQNMFSILNEIKDDSPASIVSVVGSSIGGAASMYILVAITGYLTFGNDVAGNIVSQYPPSVASTIGKAAIVVLVTFSIPLQVHPCRASLDAISKWRPNAAQNNTRSSSPGGRPLLGGAGDSPRGDHAPSSPMSDNRFAVFTTLILVVSYLTALSVSSLDRMLAWVGSTGSTSISFILPGLFYYKISDPEGIHHQRLTKENDDVDVEDSSPTDVEEGLAASTTSLMSTGNVTAGMFSTWRRKWRWDLEHLEHGLLRKLALALAYYGIGVMVVCLIMNIVLVGSADH